MDLLLLDIHINKIITYVAFVSGVFYLKCSQSSSMVQRESVLRFLWLNTSLYGYTTFCLSIRQLTIFELFPFAIINNNAMKGMYKLLYRHMFQFPWVYE